MGSTDSISTVPVAARAFQGRRAGVVTRCLAAAVDVAVVAALLGLAYLGLTALVFMWNTRDPHLPDIPRLVVILAYFWFAVGYLTTMWTASGRTLGNQLLGLRVTDGRGDRLRLVRSFPRALLCAALPIGLLLCAVTRSKSSLADLLLRTRVIYDWSAHAASITHAG